MKKLLVAFLMLALAAPAFAGIKVNVGDCGTLDLYGTIRMAVAYQNTSSKMLFYHGIPGAEMEKTWDGNNFRALWQGNSRVGVNYKQGGFFVTLELNILPEAFTGVKFRQAFGGYTADNGFTFIAGIKDSYDGYQGAYSDVWMTDNGLVGFGAIQSQRVPQFILEYKGLALAIITQEVDNYVTNVEAYKKWAPRFALSYRLMGVKSLGFKAFASVSPISLDVEGLDINGKKSKAVTAFHIGFLVSPKFGKFGINLGAFFAQNAALYNAVQGMARADDKGNLGTTASYLRPTYDGDKLSNVSTFGVALEFCLNLSKAIALNIGGGLQSSTADHFRTIDGSKKSVMGYGVYVNLPIKVVSNNLMLVPQFGYYGRSTKAYVDGASNVSGFMLGVQCRVNF